ncbi:MAG: sensor domain-containing diguanylate cyclase [Thermoleophilaceae bacterium]
MDTRTKTAYPHGDKGAVSAPAAEAQRAELSVVEPGPEPAAAALPVSSSLDARFLTLAGTLDDIVSLHEPGRGCVYASAAARSMLGADPAELVGRDWADLVPQEDANPFAGSVAAQVSHRLLRPYGPPLVAETTVTPVEENGAVVQLLCVTRGFDSGGWELPDSLRDRLTGLPTRDVLVDRLSSLLAYGQMPVAAIVVDLDHLAAVSARFGRDASDRVLAETASRVQATLRPTDLLGRLEDERLCALCLGVGDSQAVLRIAERIRSVVASPLPFEPVIATASVGAALTAPGGDPEAVLRRAARAAQAVKRRGGNAAFLDGI